MPSVREKTTKTGSKFYEIRVSRGREKGYLSTRWYPPEGWSRKAIEAAKIKTLKQYGEGVFMPTKSVTMSENGRGIYQGILDRWIYPALGELKLPEITPAEISALLLSMQAAGKAQSTCAKAYTVLKSLFKMAYMADLIDHNPMAKVERPKPRKDEMKKPAEAESYTADELKHILDCLQNEPLKWQAYMSLLIDTGVRRGEACGLKWECVGLTGRGYFPQCTGGGGKWRIGQSIFWERMSFFYVFFKPHQNTLKNQNPHKPQSVGVFLGAAKQI
ncbi:MAG: hypothetical protein HFE88_08270 [Acutalibacter sp.]|nr:hypothetical protein [Acutalibacter sp.]